MLGSEALVREALATEALATEALATEALATEALATEAAATKALATQALATKALATEALATEALATEAPAKTAPAREALARIQTLRQLSKRKSKTWQPVDDGGALEKVAYVSEGGASTDVSDSIRVLSALEERATAPSRVPRIPSVGLRRPHIDGKQRCVSTNGSGLRTSTALSVMQELTAFGPSEAVICD